MYKLHKRVPAGNEKRCVAHLVVGYCVRAYAYSRYVYRRRTASGFALPKVDVSDECAKIRGRWKASLEIISRGRDGTLRYNVRIYKRSACLLPCVVCAYLERKCSFGEEEPLPSVVLEVIHELDRDDRLRSIVIISFNATAQCNARPVTAVHSLEMNRRR